MNTDNDNDGNNIVPTEWEKEFREYFDKCLKPKKPTIKNLDRELCVDFIRKLLLKTRTAEQERVVGILQNMRGVYSARDVIEKATEAIRGNENGV